MDILNPLTPEEKGLLSELKAARKKLADCVDVVRKYKEFYGVAESGLWSGEDIADLLTEIEGKLLEVYK